MEMAADDQEANKECDLQRYIKKRVHKKYCTEDILPLAKMKQQEMTEIITVPFLNTLPDNMTLYMDSICHNGKCIVGKFKNTIKHACVCNYTLSFHNIKYNEKTYKFDMPKPDEYSGEVGTLDIRHCACHHDTGDNTFYLTTEQSGDC